LIPRVIPRVSPWPAITRAPNPPTPTRSTRGLIANTSRNAPPRLKIGSGA
jgi:hypothetical protein